MFRQRIGGDVSEQNAHKISVLIIDDHPTLRAGIRTLLEKAPDIFVVGEAGSGDEAEILVNRLRPKIILLDLKMPDFSPVKFEEWAREQYPETITLVLTAHDRDAYLAGMMDAGAVGYLDKDIKEEQLINAIRLAVSGVNLYDEQQIERARQWRDDTTAKWESLSLREREVLQLLADGQDNQSISTSLRISINTVEKHLKNLYKKLEVASRTEAVHWWVEQGTDFRT